MLVTKNVAELCVLLISELYGQLPSRIFADLLARGRSTVAQLAQHTFINQRQVRHGVAVLIQLNLIFHLTDQDTGITHYEANHHAAYNLVRMGKILDMVRTKYGHHAHYLVHEVLIQGHAKISDLIEAFKNKQDARNGAVNGTLQNGHNHVNGNGNSNSNGNGIANGSEDVKSGDSSEDTDDLVYGTLAQLIATGILEPVMPTMYQSPQDLRSSVEQAYLADFPTGIRGSKQTAEFEKSVRERLKDIQKKNTYLKRRLEDEIALGPTTKRRKLTNGGMSNSNVGDGARNIVAQQFDTALRVNYDKCTVELRNLKLERYVDDLVGDTTAKVYATLLAVLGKKVSRCQIDRSLEIEDDNDVTAEPRVTTQEVFEQLNPSIDLSTGIGKLHGEGTIDIKYAEKIRRYPPQLKGSTLKETLEEDEEIIGSDDEDYDHSGEAADHFGLHGQNGTNGVEVQEDDGVPVGSRRLHEMRQHLLILAESSQGFVRHCGENEFGEWTVDFEPLIQHLKFLELDTIIENRFGRQGLRLTRILREKGKIDDKTLPGLALMKKPDVHVKMAEMEMAGFLDVQEVPRDNNRAAARTIFFWFFDLDRTLQRILDNTYKSMVRCFQRLEVERQKKKSVLEMAERKDVQGIEEDRLRGDVYNDYIRLLDIEKKLLGQVAKLDDIVSVLRDF
ncbi:RNA polymerase III subunit RPC82-domain-containing protein [Annulohypoxylon maeteangense]|uniref:RNA polymerase III subunit RPC82-domain-containing protein n=1 Tax=Annulohypoxylon maeteangense TaxID=1927788 RepID=UPI0020079B2F|nr:RNA polymerase III subunit RPC82-domain-containing protein [Annulohypoxylon maeteangense]KAI0884501.1 RNA polymerase III subunit RPC82-domain-containing protein [Annulohypoxylon maeteangense]